MHIAVRLLAMAFGFLFASLAGGTVLMLAAFIPAVGRLALDPFAFESGFMLAIGIIFFSGPALLCALLLGTLAEAMRWRSVLYHAAAGALTGAFIGAEINGFDLSMAMAGGNMQREMEVLTGAGIVAGLVYWVIAGRNAGFSVRAA